LIFLIVSCKQNKDVLNPDGIYYSDNSSLNSIQYYSNNTWKNSGLQWDDKYTSKIEFAPTDSVIFFISPPADFSKWRIGIPVFLYMMHPIHIYGVVR